MLWHTGSWAFLWALAQDCVIAFTAPLSHRQTAGCLSCAPQASHLAMAAQDSASQLLMVSKQTGLRCTLAQAVEAHPAAAAAGVLLHPPAVHTFRPPCLDVEQEGYNVDSLAAIPGSNSLVAGLSSFIGREWTGAVAVLGPAADGRLQAQALLPVRAGVPAVACLPQPDEFTGAQGCAEGSHLTGACCWEGLLRASCRGWPWRCRSGQAARMPLSPGATLHGGISRAPFASRQSTLPRVGSPIAGSSCPCRAARPGQRH